MRRLASGCGVTMLAFALSACEGVGSVGLVTTGPSAPAAITASINYVSVSQAPAFGVSACTGSRAAAFDIVVVASVPMHLNNVTIQLVDGSNVGGPMVTFPQASLSTQFGTTNVLAATARTFRLSPRFPCGILRPDHVAAQLSLVDAGGTLRGVAIAGPLP